MTFYSLTGAERPVRLSEKTRLFAHESLDRKYGKDTLDTPAVTLDDIEGFEILSPVVRYDTAIRRIAEKAPLRICEGELISGAATLGLAIDHQIPAVFGGKPVFSSISHLTIDFETVLRKGISHIRREAEAAFERHKGTEREEFARSCLNCLDSFAIWQNRYIRTLEKMPGYEENARILKKVPLQPAENFREAVQSLWFTFAFVRLCGNWPGIGRLDMLLGKYLEKDLTDGLLTVYEARELLAHFFIKGCEWVTGESNGSGDAQHYQNILLAGVDENGNEVTNTVTWLTLDILEELGIGDFPTTVRLNRNTDEKLLRRVAEVMRYGGGILAVYNEDLIIKSLTGCGYPLTEARKFANDGCWEVQIPGKTDFIYMPFDSYT
ncbi:MAG: pyruvate formate lyase family protein, partial [Oscillospiraceae bacterium]|nr:pyruvate formate lyase family protein [Oscillospiraceae bacterium]